MAKKTYEKPKVTKVQLKSEESALTACKQRGQGGPWLRCNTGGHWWRCREIGS